MQLLKKAGKVHCSTFSPSVFQGPDLADPELAEVGLKISKVKSRS